MGVRLLTHDRQTADGMENLCIKTRQIDPNSQFLSPSRPEVITSACQEAATDRRSTPPFNQEALPPKEEHHLRYPGGSTVRNSSPPLSRREIAFLF